MDNELRDALERALKAMPDDFRKGLMKMMMHKSDATVGDPVKREEVRTRLMEEGNKEAIEGFMVACHMYDTNKCAVQALGNIKQMLNRFDENDLSSGRLLDNLNMIKHISMVIGIATHNIGDGIEEFMGDRNDFRTGETPS